MISESVMFNLHADMDQARELIAKAASELASEVRASGVIEHSTSAPEVLSLRGQVWEIEAGLSELRRLLRMTSL